MQVQLFIGDKAPISSEMDPIQNDHWVKPRGGLWTSSWRPETQDSEWVEWCRSEQFSHTQSQNPSGWLLYPKKDIRLLIIDSKLDCQQLFAAYSNKNLLGMLIDFEAMQEQYDGIHLTSRGQMATRYMFPGLYGWDCESTLWFNWQFIEIKKLEITFGVESDSVESDV